jgi:hypothetical protein
LIRHIRPPPDLAGKKEFSGNIAFILSKSEKVTPKKTIDTSKKEGNDNSEMLT